MDPYSFDVNGPTSLDAIQGYIGRYGSPEAAERDTRTHAPGGYDYLQKSYQSLTGDDFADPFEDAVKARDSALMSAVVAGRNGFVAPDGNTPAPQLSVNVGGINGPTVNPATAVIAQRNVVDRAKAATAAAAPPPLLPSFEQVKPTLPGQPQSPFALADKTQEIQRQRSNALGVGDVFNHLLQNNPNALSSGSSTDPDLQLDAKGKPVAGDVLNAHLFSDPKFQTLLKTAPDKARKLYTALYDRDYDTDLASQRGANVKRGDVRDKVLGELSKNLIFDDVTGEPQTRTFQRDPITGDQIEGKPRALSAIESHFIEQEGGFEGRFGFKPPPRADLTPSETEKLRSTRDQILKDHPDTPKDVALLQARKQLTLSTAAPPSAAASTGPSKLSRLASAGYDLLRAPANTLIDQENKTLAGLGVNYRDPTLGPIRPEEFSSAMTGATDGVFDWLRDKQSKVAGLLTAPPSRQQAATW